MKRILFDLNVPADLHIIGRTDMYVGVSARKYLNDKIATEFIELETSTVVQITNWSKLYMYACECAEKQWEARENAAAIGDMTVDEKGNISAYPVKEEE